MSADSSPPPEDDLDPDLSEMQKLAVDTKDTLGNRRDTRFKTIYGGQTRYRGKTKKCLIFDLSEGGAKLQHVEGIPLHESFDIFIDRLGPFKAIQGEAMWIRGDKMGVQFTSSPLKLRLMLRKLLPSRFKTAEAGSE